jgi:hypothetical protein
MISIKAEVALSPRGRGQGIQSFELPTGTESLLFRFKSGTTAERLFGAFCETDDGGTLSPGREVGVTLRFWSKEAGGLKAGERFVVWYGGDVGRGTLAHVVESHEGDGQPGTA